MWERVMCRVGGAGGAGCEMSEQDGVREGGWAVE